MQAPLANNFTTNGVSLPIQVESITKDSLVWSPLHEDTEFAHSTYTSQCFLCRSWQDHDVLARFCHIYPNTVRCLQAHPLLTVLHP